MPIPTASELRGKAIAQLKAGIGHVAQGFRGEYSAANTGEDYKAFLTKQGKDGVWATDIEASALAEALQVNLVVTAHNSDGIEHTFVLYRTEQATAPTLHLHNWSNAHWSFGGPESTPGDGNCLYHAFRQAMTALNAQQNSEPGFFKKQPVATKPVSHEETPVLASGEREAIQLQEIILAMVQKAKRPSEIAREQAAETARIAKLSPEEQKQIRDDYDYALRVAMDQ